MSMLSMDIITLEKFLSSFITCFVQGLERVMLEANRISAREGSQFYSKETGPCVLRGQV